MIEWHNQRRQVCAELHHHSLHCLKTFALESRSTHKLMDQKLVGTSEPALIQLIRERVGEASSYAEL